MNLIKLIKQLQLNGGHPPVDDIEFERLFDGPNRTIVEIRIGKASVLKRHHAEVPITVLCLSGHGTFNAGAELEESQELGPGTLITLDAHVEHAVTAIDELHLIVSKFKLN